MIIASPAKKEISIPLQPMASAVAFLATKDHQEDQPSAVDLVTISPRNKDSADAVTQVFGQAHLLSGQVDELLHITTTHSTHQSTRALSCEAFIHNDTVFLTSPFVGNNAGLLNWTDGEFQSCINHLIDLAEEKTGCSALVIAIDRQNHKDSLHTVLRAFMYLGFTMVSPLIYGQEPGYSLVGYEL